MLMSLALIVLISASDGSQELALHDAAQEVLGDTVRVSVRVTTPLPDAESAPQLMASAHADAIALVNWLDVARRRAEIRVFRLNTPGWLSRTIEFDGADSVAEKGRSLGLVIAAMLPDAVQASAVPPAQPAPPSVEPPPVSAPATPAGAAVASQSAPAAAPTGPPPAAEPVAPHPPPSAAETISKPMAAPTAHVAEASPPGRSIAFDAAANGALTLGGAGSGFGGTLAGQLDLGASRLAVRVEAAVRAGHVAVLEGRSLTLDVMPGLAWTPLQFTGSNIDLELRLAALVRYLSLTQEHAVSETHARWLPGARGAIAGLWWFARRWALAAAVGLDATFGKTSIVWKGTQVADVTPCALTLELGIRIQL